MFKKLLSFLTAITFLAVSIPASATMQDIGPQGFPYPNYNLYIGTLEDSNNGINAVSLATSTSRVAFMGRVYQNDLTCRNGSATKNIQQIGFLAGAKSGTWVAQVDVESVDTGTGNPVHPTGTILGGGLALATIASASVTAQAQNVTPNLTAVATVHCFDEIAIVISFSAYTSGSLNIAGGLATDPSPWGPVQSNSTNGGTTWTAASVSAGGTVTALLEIKFDDGTRGTFEGTAPLTYLSSVQTGLNTTSTPREVGLQFSAPYDGQVNGFWFYITLTNSSSNATLKLTDTAGTPNVLASINLLGSQSNHAGGSQGWGWFPITTGRITLTRGTNYVLAMAGTSATPNNAIWTKTAVSATASMTAFYACGTTCGQVTRNTSSATWSGFTNTTIPVMAINYIAIDDNTGP